MAEQDADDFDIQNAHNVEPEYGEMLIEDRLTEYLISFKAIPGAETLPPDRINIAPHLTVRIYESGDTPSEEYLLVTGLPHATTFHIDRAVLFDGSVQDMAEHIVREFDDGDWSHGIKKLTEIRAKDGYESVKMLLEHISTILEDAAGDRKDWDAWEEYTLDPDRHAVMER